MYDMAKLLKQEDVLPNNRPYLLLRATLTAQRPKDLHQHTFYEVFWVQNGHVRHHMADRIDVLAEGDLVLVAPGQVHALQSKGDHSMVVSVCLQTEVVDGLRRRHADAWPIQGEPSVHRLDLRALAALNQSALNLERSPNAKIATEAFLLTLLAGLQAENCASDGPEWLGKALQKARDPGVFRLGAAGLVASTGRAHPHVSRVTRKYLGQTPTEYINTVRMEYAANQLLSDVESVSAIAADCGLPNMAHFHKLFKAAFGISPLQYRQKYRQDIIQPI